MRIIMLNFISIIFVILVISCDGYTNGKIEASGTIEITEINISSKNADEVADLKVGEGAYVSSGDLLAIINHSILDLQLKQYEAQAGIAKAQLELLLKGTRTEDLQIAEETVLQAKTNYQDAEKDLARVKDLFEKGNISEKEKENGENKYAVTKAQYNSALLTLNKLKKGAREEEINSAKFQYNQNLAIMEVQKQRIDDCFVKSPVNGIVTNQLVEIGEFVNVGTPIYTISKTDTAYLTIYVTEPELGHINIGDEAKIKIDSDPKKVLIGRIIYISPNAEFTPKNIQTKEDRVKQVFGVKIEISNEEGILKAGMPADALIE